MSLEGSVVPSKDRAYDLLKELKAMTLEGSVVPSLIK